MDEAMIEIKDVSMRFRLVNDRISSVKEYAIARLRGKLKYNEFEALKHVSFDVKRGEVMGLIGHNGAGKSTLLKIISGILKPTEGSVIVRGNVAPMLELGSGFDFDMTGRENILLNGAILGYSEDFLKSKYDEIVAFSEIGPFIDMPLRNYSSGMVTRLAFPCHCGGSGSPDCGRGAKRRRCSISRKKLIADDGTDEWRYNSDICQPQPRADSKDVWQNALARAWANIDVWRYSNSIGRL